jgi:hypothetical protein
LSDAENLQISRHSPKNPTKDSNMIITNKIKNKNKNKNKGMHSDLLKYSVKEIMKKICKGKSFKLNGISEKITKKKQYYLFHFVPDCTKADIDYFKYIFSVLQPEISLLLMLFKIQISLQKKIAKANNYNIKKTFDCDIKITFSDCQFVVLMEKNFIKDLHILTPVSKSQIYIVDSFNNALFQLMDISSESKIDSFQNNRSHK